MTVVPRFCGLGVVSLPCLLNDWLNLLMNDCANSSLLKPPLSYMKMLRQLPPWTSAARRLTNEFGKRRDVADC